MKRPPIKVLRRLALAAALAMVVVLAGSYGLRRWRAYQARREVPAAIPGDVQQQAEKFTFSRSEGGRVLFTVQASRTIERAGKSTVLEDVVTVIYGRSGERADEIRTDRCEYDRGGTGQIYCPGEVTIRLGGEVSRPSAGGEHWIRLVTSGMRFDPEPGVAWTDQPVRFRFSGGWGEAVGLRYQPGEPALQLEAQVSIHLARGAEAPVRIEAARLHYYARRQVLELLPPLSLRLQDRLLVADRVRMELDQNLRTRRIEAVGHVRARGVQDGRQLTMQARRAVALYSPEGALQQLSASGSVRFTAESQESRETLSCREAVFHFSPPRQRLERVVAAGDAELVLRTPEETRELRAPVMELTLGSQDGDRQLLTARRRAALVLRQPSGEERILVADRIELEFQQKRRLRRLAASGSVETKLVRPGAPLQMTSSEELRARFDSEGKLAEAEQWGGFRYQGENSWAEAGRAHYRGETQTVLLTEEPAIWDATTRTTARRIELEETTGRLRAEGEVRTTQRPAAGQKGGFGSSAPVNLAADRLWAERARGWARYEGHARMWQDESRLAADVIELFRSPRKLVGEGHVRGLFFETPAAPEASANPGGRRRPVTVTARRFTYLESERRGVFEENVVARNDFGTLTAPRLEVFLAAGPGGETVSLERAHASGGVRIQQPGRQATSERADYRADARTVILSGGSPTITDLQGSSITGSQLTLFLADGRIRVDSEEGERTVTRRPWTQ